MECKEEYAHCILHCGSSLNIKTIVEQKKILEEALSKKKLIIIRANEIVEIDTAALQLLLNFTVAVGKANLTWAFEAPSTILVQAAELLGIRELLKLPNT